MEWLETIGKMIADRLNASRSDNRHAPYAVLALAIIGAPTLGALIGLFIGAVFFDSPLIASVAMIMGITAGILVIMAKLEQLFIIRNPTTGMFITQDMWKSIQGKSDEEIHVSYPPGVHICLPWERRLKENNISLEEAAQEFEIRVQCEDGVLFGKGSYRLRPDEKNGVTFLRGVAAVAAEISDLIAADAVNFLSDKKVLEARGMLAEFNKHLNAQFANDDHHTDIEKRFGIEVTDVTVNELLPSDELQRTISALSEADAIAKGTAIILGYSSARAVRTALTQGKITRADYDEARDRFMAASGNLDGMEIKRNEWVLKFPGLDPETAETLRDIAKSPAAQAYAAKAASKGGRSSKPRKKPQPKNSGGNS